MGIKDLRRGSFTPPPKREPVPGHAGEPGNKVDGRRRELSALRAARGVPPAAGSPYSAFVDWASPGALPFPDEEALAIRQWAGLDEGCEDDSASSPAGGVTPRI